MAINNGNNQLDIQPFLDQPHTLLEQSVDVQRVIANYPDTPRELLEILINSDDAQIAEAASLHVNWAGEWVSTVPGDWHTEVDRILQSTPLGQNDRLAVELLKLGPVPPACLSEWIPASVWTKALQNPHIPLRYQIQMVDLSDQESRLESRLWLAESPETPIAVLEQLIGEIDPQVRLAAQVNPRCPSNQIDTVKADYERAAYWYTYQSDLTTLSQSRWAWIRLVVAQNPSTPEPTLAILALDRQVKIQLAVMQNPSTPESLVTELAGNRKVQEAIATHRIRTTKFPSWSHYRTHLAQERTAEEQKANAMIIRRLKSPYALAQVVKKGDREAKINAAHSPLTPINTLVKLAQEPDETIRSAVSKNSNLPLEQILILAQDSSFKVRSGLAQYSARKPTPTTVLAKLALDESPKIRTLMAQNQHTPVEILEQLAQEDNRDILTMLSRNPKTPAHLLELIALRASIINPYNANTPANAFVNVIEGLLARDNPRGSSYYKDEKLGKLLKHSHPSIPGQLLEKLADYPRDWIRSHVAFHPNTPASALDRLADEQKYDSIRWGVANNPNTSDETLERLLANETPDQSGYRSTMDYLTKRSSLSPRLFELLVSHDDPKVRKAIAQRSDCPAALSDRCAETETDENVLQALARNPNLTAHALTQLLQKPYPDIHLTLVRHPNLTVDHWRSLLAHPSVEVRCRVAASSDILPELLTELSTDDSEDVRYALASNANLPTEGFQQLSNDPSLRIRRAIASHHATPPSVLEQLANDASIDVRRAVAENPQIPMEVRVQLQDLVPLSITSDQTPALSLTLQALPRLYKPESDDLPEFLRDYAQAENAFVRFVTLLHPLTPFDVLEEGVRSPFWLERYAIADNPSTTVAMLQTLAQDANRLVRVCTNSRIQGV